MKIVVIGSSPHIRSETVARLRQSGHEVIVAPRRNMAIAGAPRDPGYAGRPLRELLEHIAALASALWRNRHAWLGLLQRRPGRRAPSDRAPHDDRIR